VEEHVVAPPWMTDLLLMLSPKSMHVASMRKRDGNSFVTVDGVNYLDDQPVAPRANRDLKRVNTSQSGRRPDSPGLLKQTNMRIG